MVPTLIFHTIDDLDSYLKSVDHNNIITDYNNISVTGPFGEEEIELAVNGFQAIHIGGKE